MIIQVTKKDIREGKKWDMYDCPIALALKRMGYKSPKVWQQKLTLHNDIETVYILSKKVRSFICNFDEGNKVKPFKFKIEGLV